MKRAFVIGIGLLMILAGCSRSDEEFVPILQEKDRIHFGIAGIATRAPVESDEYGTPKQEVNGIQLIRGIDGDDAANAFISLSPLNIVSEASLGIEPHKTKLILTNPQYFDAAHNPAHFMAYHPVAKEGYPKDGAKVVFSTPEWDKDIMVSGPRTAQVVSSNGEVSFYFTHLLARVELSLIAGDESAKEVYGPLSSAKVEGVPTEVEFTIQADGRITDLTKSTPEKAGTLDFGRLTFEDETTQKGFMVYPDASSWNKISLTFEKQPGKTFDIDIKDMKLEAGKISIIEVTVNATGISFKLSVAGWGDPIDKGEIPIGNENEI